MSKLRFMRLVFAGLIAGMVSFPGVSFAEEGVLEIGEVVVTATRVERPIETIPASVTVITREEIEKTQAKTVDDLLGRELGMRAIRGRGLMTCPGGFSFNMRGTGDLARVLILKDGISLNTKMFGKANAFDLSALSLQDIERIEIVRGAASALYGSSAMGGVINIITRRVEPGLSGNVGIEAGSFDTGIGSLGLRYGADNFALRFAFERKQTGGYKDKDPWQAHWKLPEIELNNISLGGDLWIGESVLNVTFDNLRTDGRDGGDERWHYTLETNRYRVNWETPLFGFGEDTVFSLKIYYFDSEFDSNAHWFNQGTREFDILRGRWDYSTSDYGIMSQISTRFGNHHLVAGFDFSGGDLDQSWKVYHPMVSDIRAKGAQSLSAVFVNNEMHLGERVILSAGLRYDHWENKDGLINDLQMGIRQEIPEITDSAISPRGGIVYKLTENTRLRASVGTGFRAPSLGDMYSTKSLPAWGLYLLGNTELEAESLEWSYDVGVEMQPNENLDLSLTFYQSRLSNFLGKEHMIAGDPRLPDWLDPGHMMVERTINVGEVDIHGVEAGLNIRFNDKWSAFINHTYNISKVREHKTNPAYVGNYLPGSPRHVSVVGFAYDNPQLFTLSLDITNTGSRFFAMDNVVTFAGFYMVNMRVSREVFEGMKVFANVENLTDEKWQDSVHNNVGVPFNLLVGARYTF